MAFMFRPSPVFIEIAQKIAVWNGTCASNGNWAFQPYLSATTDTGAAAYYPSYFLGQRSSRPSSAVSRVQTPLGQGNDEHH